MKIHYLGTAAAEGCPALFCNCELCQTARLIGEKNIRTRSQVVIDDTLLVDFPPDTYHHTLTTPSFNLRAISHLLITHSHADHFYPQDIGLRCDDFAARMEGCLTVYGNESIASGWKFMLSEEYRAFADLPDRVNFNVLSPFILITAGKHRVTAIPANHKPDENCYIYNIEKDGVSLLYANDTGIAFSDETWDYLGKCKFNVVSMDCTAMDKRVGRRHMGLPDNADFKKRLIDIGAADENTTFIVTHFSHFGGLTHEELTKRAAVYEFVVAYDGMEIIL